MEVNTSPKTIIESTITVLLCQIEKKISTNSTIYNKESLNEPTGEANTMKLESIKNKIELVNTGKNFEKKTFFIVIR